jgi:hypothetical protein
LSKENPTKYYTGNFVVFALLNIEFPV